MNYFVEAFGAENCVQEVFQEGTSDYSSYVTNAKSNGCDIFVAPVSTEAAALIIDQAATQDLGMPILAGDTWDSNVIVAAAQGKDNVHVYVTTFYQEGGNAEFDAAFKEWINSDSVNLENNGGNDMIAAVSVMGYDAYYVALEAIKLLAAPTRPPSWLPCPASATMASPATSASLMARRTRPATSLSSSTATPRRAFGTSSASRALNKRSAGANLQ